MTQALLTADQIRKLRHLATFNYKASNILKAKMVEVMTWKDIYNTHAFALVANYGHNYNRMQTLLQMLAEGVREEKPELLEFYGRELTKNFGFSWDTLPMEGNFWPIGFDHGVECINKRYEG